MIDISVIIPVYNAAVFIGKCLDSIIAQTGNYSYEVILVDDGSTDNSIDVINSYDNNNFKLISQKNAGPSVARNRGINEAKGKYIAFLDSDDYWKPDFFDKMYQFLEANSECIGVSCVQQVHTVSGDRNLPVIEKSTPFVIDDFFNFWGIYMHICPGGAMMKSSAVKKMGGMREDLRVTEDWEFWAYSALYGKWGVVPEILFVGCGADTVSSSKGWYERMGRRWANAPTVEEWEKRIISGLRTKGEDIPNGYYKALGNVGRTLVYSQVLSGRYSLARSQALKYGRWFVKDPIGILMNICKKFNISWLLLCKFLQYREKHRFAS